jgi:hypothetical protein
MSIIISEALPSNTHWLNNAFWLTVGGVIYFRGAITSDRNLRRFQIDGGRDVSDETIAEVKKRGPVKLYDPRVLLSAVLLSLPAWFALVASPNLSHILMLISLGALVAPLRLPTIRLSRSDFRSPLQLIAKWSLGKIDVYVKTLVLMAVCFVLLKIPGISYLGTMYAKSAFPIIEGAGAHIFEEISKAGVASLIIMYFIRLSQIFIHGMIFCIIWASSLGFVWVTLQFEASVILRVSPLAITGLLVFATRLGIDFINDVIEVLTEAPE